MTHWSWLKKEQTLLWYLTFITNIRVAVAQDATLSYNVAQVATQYNTRGKDVLYQVLMLPLRLSHCSGEYQRIWIRIYQDKEAWITPAELDHVYWMISRRGFRYTLSVLNSSKTNMEHYRRNKCDTFKLRWWEAPVLNQQSRTRSVPPF
jgi:hypothetical protein